jgi:hypothetical protein
VRTGPSGHVLFGGDMRDLGDHGSPFAGVRVSTSWPRGLVVLADGPWAGAGAS